MYSHIFCLFSLFLLCGYYLFFFRWLNFFGSFLFSFFCFSFFLFFFVFCRCWGNSPPYCSPFPPSFFEPHSVARNSHIKFHLDSFVVCILFLCCFLLLVRFLKTTRSFRSQRFPAILRRDDFPIGLRGIHRSTHSLPTLWSWSSHYILYKGIVTIQATLLQYLFYLQHILLQYKDPLTKQWAGGYIFSLQFIPKYFFHNNPTFVTV